MSYTKRVGAVAVVAALALSWGCSTQPPAKQNPPAPTHKLDLFGLYDPKSASFFLSQITDESHQAVIYGVP